jgi:hypothetical protein
MSNLYNWICRKCYWVCDKFAFACFIAILFWALVKDIFTGFRRGYLNKEIVNIGP